MANNRAAAPASEQTQALIAALYDIAMYGDRGNPKGLRQSIAGTIAALASAPQAASERPLPPLPEPDGFALLTPNGTRLVSPQEAKGYKSAYPFYTAQQVNALILADRAASASQAVRRPLTEERAAVHQVLTAEGLYMGTAFVDTLINAAHGIVPLAPQDTGGK